MSSADERPRSDSDLPAEQVWHVGSRGFVVASLVLSCLAAGLVVARLATGAVDSTGDALMTALWAALVVVWVLQALMHLTFRVMVDSDGVHWLNLLLRRKYSWDDIAEIRPGRRTLFKPHVELVRKSGKVVALPNMGGHLDDLRRRHAAATADR